MKCGALLDNSVQSDCITHLFLGSASCAVVSGTALRKLCDINMRLFIGGIRIGLVSVQNYGRQEGRNNGMPLNRRWWCHELGLFERTLYLAQTWWDKRIERVEQACYTSMSHEPACTSRADG